MIGENICVALFLKSLATTFSGFGLGFNMVIC